MDDKYKIQSPASWVNTINDIELIEKLVDSAFSEKQIDQ